MFTLQKRFHTSTSNVADSQGAKQHELKEEQKLTVDNVIFFRTDYFVLLLDGVMWLYDIQRGYYTEYIV